METKDIFLERLKDLTIEHDITIKKLSDDIGLNVRTVRRWFRERAPKVESLIKLANYFNCSIDYLVGLSDTEFDFPNISDKIIFTERYNKLKDAAHLNDAKIAALCKISAPTICRWNNGAIPDFEIVVKLCKIFDCSFEYIIGRVD